MRVQLRDLTPGTEYAVQFRSNNGEEVSEWSQVQRFTTTNDTIAPAPVTNLTWGQSGSSFVATWDKPTKDALNNPLLDFRDFQIEIDDTVNGFKHIVHTVDTMYILSEDEHVKAFGVRKPSLRVTVKVRDLTYNVSTAVTATASMETPPVPSAPTIGNYLGMLNVIWDGKAVGGISMPESFAHAEVHVSTTSQFAPTDSTFKARLTVDGSSASAVIPGLAYDALVYVRLVSVSKLNKKSGPSTQASGTPTRVSGLDVKNGTLTKDQINFTAAQIGGANSYYQTTAPTTGMVAGDLWYDTDDGYEVYRYNGAAWVLAPEVGMVYSKRIVAGAITGDKIATNFFAAALARIGTAYIDEAMVQSVSAASIRTGSLQADQRIIAGPATANHAEMTSSGFYVKGPQPGSPGTMIDRIRMGTGVSDFFAIPDPINTDDTLAQIDETGIGSFQGLSSDKDITVMGKRLIGDLNDTDPRYLNENDPGVNGLMSQRAFRPIANAEVSISGLEVDGVKGIRSEYGLWQMRVPVVAGRMYLVHFLPPIHYITAFGEIRVLVRQQRDLRTKEAQILDPATSAATQVTNTSHLVFLKLIQPNTGAWQNEQFSFVWYPDFTGYANLGLSLECIPFNGTDAVVKVNNSNSQMAVFDMGQGPRKVVGHTSNQGGSLYAYTEPPPPPPPATQNYYAEAHWDWLRAYKGNFTHMDGSNGRAYQGQDPSGYNGNQFSHLGWSMFDLQGALSGATNIRIVLYLYFAHWYNNSGGTAVIGYHNQRYDPGTANATGGAYQLLDSGGWPKPGGREIDISGWAGAAQNGSFKGITIGAGRGSSLGYYGYVTDAALQVWWTK